jgi:metal-sulfur cluster biosynthetic enzyme
MTLKHPKCLMGGVVVEQAEAAPADPECATRTELTFDPPWTLDHIAFRGRHELGRSE